RSTWTLWWPRPRSSSTPPSAPWHERAAVFRGVPGVRRPAPRHVAAFAVRDRRRGSGGHGVGGPAARGSAEMVAGPAPGPDRLWRLTLSILVLVRRQRAADQPRLAGRGRTAGRGRLPERLVLAHHHRLRDGQELQVRAAGEGMEELRPRRATGSPARLRR